MSPMDEALTFTALDFSNRPYLVFDAEMPQERIGDYDSCLTLEFMRAVAVNGGITLHQKCFYRVNAHHITEGLFKSLGLAVKDAVRIEGRPGHLHQGGALMGWIGIVDYGVGNLMSVSNALSFWDWRAESPATPTTWNAPMPSFCPGWELSLTRRTSSAPRDWTSF